MAHTAQSFAYAVECPVCSARPGRACHRVQSPKVWSGTHAKRIRLANFDNTRAHQEGWSLRLVDNKWYQLQKLDESDLFEEDCDAWEYVVARAKAGSAYHRRALDFLAKHNRHEHRLVTEQGGMSISP